MPEKCQTCLYPRAAVAVVITLDDRVLFGQRKIDNNQHRHQWQWQLPGGWIRNGEAPEAAARREVEEETGLKLDRLDLVALTNNIFSAQNHSISLCFEAECHNPNEVALREPEKCRGWHCQKWDELDNNFFLPLEILKKSDYRPFIRDKREIGISF
jgi:8-oxo-dGTP diphosphatase